MDIEKEKFSLIKIIKIILSNFAVAILLVSFVGWAVKDLITERIDGIMSLAGVGLSYSAIFQMLLFSIAATLSGFIFSQFFKKIMALWRYVLIIASMYGLAIIFAVVFKWFPLDLSQAWLYFILSFSLSMAISVTYMVLKTKLADKKYGRQLSEYKKNLH
jgi:uncharacterized RDD family membrane protein YckC